MQLATDVRTRFWRNQISHWLLRTDFRHRSTSMFLVTIAEDQSLLQKESDGSQYRGYRPAVCRAHA